MLDRFLHARNALPGEQLHAGRALELREFLLEGEQALAGSCAPRGRKYSPSVRAFRSALIELLRGLADVVKQLVHIERFADHGDGRRRRPRQHGHTHPGAGGQQEVGMTLGQRGSASRAHKTPMPLSLGIS